MQGVSALRHSSFWAHWASVGLGAAVLLAMATPLSAQLAVQEEYADTPGRDLFPAVDRNLRQAMNAVGGPDELSLEIKEARWCFPGEFPPELPRDQTELIKRALNDGASLPG